jgi:uncharacterized repeat protein (TIGR01451 family)
LDVEDIMNRIIVLSTLALLLAALTPIAPAPPHATLDLALQERLATAAPTEQIPVLVLLRERVDWDTLYPTLATLDRRTRHERVVRVLQETAGRTQGPLLAFLDTETQLGHVAQATPFWAANAIALSATPEVLHQLARRPDVLYVQEDHIYPLDNATGGAGTPAPAASPNTPEPGLVVIGADQLWARGWDGADVLVATIDTGAYLPHPALETRWRGNEPGVTPDEAWFDYWGVTTTPSDTVQCSSHGTHVMGTILGDDGAGNQIGVAPGARWIAARIFGPPGSGCSSSDSTKLAGYQWVLDPDGNPGTVDDFPQVVNRSGGERGPGGGGLCRPLPDPIWDAITAVAAAGATIFFGAGNEGSYGPESIISWASQSASPILAFSVGNVDGSSLIIHYSSSRGPSPCDHVTIKPEVVAPGVNIRSSVIGGYGSKTGTSMSTPHTSGAAAILWTAFPYAGAEQIQYALLNGAQDLGPAGEDNDYGMGLVYLPGAYHWLFNLDPSTAAVTPTLAAPGARLSYTVALRNGGEMTGTARMSDTLPAEVTFVPGSLWASGGTYGYSDGTVAWQGTVDPALPVTVTFAVTLSMPLADGQIVTNVTRLDNGLVWTMRDAAVLVDALPPTSQAASPAYARTPFTVTFAASDTVSGVAWTRLWQRYEGGPWTDTGQGQPGETGTFPVTPTQGDGHYYYATQSLDEIGWVEAPPEDDGDTVTHWDTIAPTSTAFSPEVSTVPTFTVSWAGGDGPAGSGIAGYRIEVLLESTPGSTWTLWLSATTALSDTFSGAPGERYCFRSMAWDEAGNTELPPEMPGGDSCTLVEQGWRVFLPLVNR